MQALKAIVIILGVLIVVGMGVLAYGLMIVRLSLADDSQRYLIFDLGTGKQLGAIELQTGGGVH